MTEHVLKINANTAMYLQNFKNTNSYAGISTRKLFFIPAHEVVVVKSAGALAGAA